MTGIYQGGGNCDLVCGGVMEGGDANTAAPKRALGQLSYIRQSDGASGFEGAGGAEDQGVGIARADDV